MNWNNLPRFVDFSDEVVCPLLGRTTSSRNAKRRMRQMRQSGENTTQFVDLLNGFWFDPYDERDDNPGLWIESSLLPNVKKTIFKYRGRTSVCYEATKNIYSGEHITCEKWKHSKYVWYCFDLNFILKVSSEAGEVWLNYPPWGTFLPPVFAHGSGVVH